MARSGVYLVLPSYGQFHSTNGGVYLVLPSFSRGVQMFCPRFGFGTDPVLCGDRDLPSFFFILPLLGFAWSGTIRLTRLGPLPKKSLGNCSYFRFYRPLNEVPRVTKRVFIEFFFYRVSLASLTEFYSI